jgi:hypothetical protein
MISDETCKMEEKLEKLRYDIQCHLHTSRSKYFLYGSALESTKSFDIAKRFVTMRLNGSTRLHQSNL